MINRNLVIILFTDAMILSTALIFAVFLENNFDAIPSNWAGILTLLAVIVSLKILSGFYFDLYSGHWRFTSITDLINIIKTVTCNIVIAAGIIKIAGILNASTVAILVIDFFISMVLISISRLSIRLFFNYSFTAKSFFPATITGLSRLVRARTHSEGMVRLAIIGAGACGEKIVREIFADPSFAYKPVAFFDDNLTLTGKKVHGVPVAGPIEKIAELSEKMSIEEVLIAIPSASAGELKTILKYITNSGMRFKIVPGIKESINKKVLLESVRNVSYSDLIGRNVVRIEDQNVSGIMKGKCLLVTGAAGTIGSELCRQLCRYHPKKLVLCDFAESGLSDTAKEISNLAPSTQIIPLLLDIKEKKRLQVAFKQFRPEIIFHAAAYKHVPMMEDVPWASVENNIGGTMNVVDAGISCGAQRLVFVSTDKAICPTSIMGASKRVAEIYIKNKMLTQKAPMKMMIVRFGNVIGSNGSVIPIFEQQIKWGGPVTVTHPEVTRYFMTSYEAAQLILQACAMGNGGEIYLLDMGERIQILQMAKDLIHLSGLVPGKDIPIKFTGLRFGEKLHETLCFHDERQVSTAHEKIYEIKGAFDYAKDFTNVLEKLFFAAKQQNVERINEIFQTIIPSYHTTVIQKKAGNIHVFKEYVKEIA